MMTIYKRMGTELESGDVVFRDIARTDFRHISRTLNDIMEMDVVIRVRPDGMIADDDDTLHMQAPELNDGELDTGDQPWVLFGSYSMQQGGGSIMHNSESIGGRMADDILSTPGLYVAIVCDWQCDCEAEDMLDGECNSNHTEGWAIATIPDEV